MPNGTALELVLRVPLRIPGTEVSFVAGRKYGRGKKGKSYFPDSLTVIRTGTEASSLSRLAQSGTTQENVHKIRLAMAISALLSRSLSDLDLGTSL